MIDPKKFIKFLKKPNKFFSGVPDSLLKPFLKELSFLPEKNNIICKNEGSAVSIGAGYYLATKKLPCIYMQNSGLGNAINPLASLVHEKVYSIPMVLIIGWRGGPNYNDEAQHLVKGKLTLKLLKLLKIKYFILKEKTKLDQLLNIIKYAKKFSKPIAIVVEKNTFSEKGKSKLKHYNGSVSRNEIIKILLNRIDKKTKLISTTGYTSRELHQLRLSENIKNGQDFYLVGGMGHATSVALGVALKKKDKVICLDGDGSLLMHLGSLTTMGYLNKNFIHILFNNKAHESVGGQKVLSNNIDFKKTLSIGYKKYHLILSSNEFKKSIISLKNGPTFLEISTKLGTFKKLSRPKDFNLIKKIFFKIS